MTSQDQLELERLLVEEYRETARNSLLGFSLYTMPEYQVNWHHRLLCQYLDRFVSGDITRLMVFMPPRVGKSELVSRRLPAYILGKDPDESVVGCSYSSALSNRMNRDIQRIMELPSYAELFPESQIAGKHTASTKSGSWARNADMFEVIGRKGVYRSTGVGGGITGMGFQTIIIDDPIKAAEDANSARYRDSLWEWYQSTLYTRLEKNGRILLTLTRWHEDDLAGRLIQLMKTDPEADQWDIITFPMEREDLSSQEDPRALGDPLWPEKFDANRCKTIKASVGSRVWSSLYQQAPTVMEGTLVKREWLRYYTSYPIDLDEKIIVADLSYKDGATNDFTVIEAWGRKGGQIYLLDQIRGRMDFPEQIASLRTMVERNPDVTGKYIEEAANGAAIISLLKNEILGLIPYKPMTAKESRLAAVSPLFEAGNVYYPDPRIAPWVEANLAELFGFPNAAHDDTVDCASMALHFLGRMTSAMNRIIALSKM